MIYIKYLRYLILHKWYVGQQCWQRGLWCRAIVHDWSKFLPREFIPYARYFYGTWLEWEQAKRLQCYPEELTKECIEFAFDKAWLMHQHRNSHHWQHHVLRQDDGETKVLMMPIRDIYEMVSDWIGAGRAINLHVPFNKDDPFKETRQWYMKNRDKIMLHPETRRIVEVELCMYKEQSNV